MKKDSFEGEKMLVLHKKSLKKLRKNRFTKHLYVTDVGYFPKAKYHYREREEGCSENILIFCTKGSGWVEMNGKKDFLSKKTLIFRVQSIKKSHQFLLLLAYF